MDQKRWYQSKAVWTALIYAVLNGVGPISEALGHPIIVPEWVFRALEGFGLYSVRDAIGLKKS